MVKQRELEEEMKQVIVVRKDLKMSRGKACAQVAHASLGASEIAMEKSESWYKAWKKRGQRKVIVYVESEEELIEVYNQAKSEALPCFIVRDAGLTELLPGTLTAAAIGPAPESKVDKITGKLKLF